MTVRLPMVVRQLKTFTMLTCPLWTTNSAKIGLKVKERKYISKRSIYVLVMKRESRTVAR